MTTTKKDNRLEILFGETEEGEEGDSYTYFVSFHKRRSFLWGLFRLEGFGSACFKVSREITTPEDIEVVYDAATEQLGGDIVILNIQLLGEE